MYILTLCNSPVAHSLTHSITKALPVWTLEIGALFFMYQLTNNVQI